VRAGGCRVDLRGAVLLRVRLARAHGGQRLHVRLRHAGRAVCVDHRLDLVLEYALGAVTVAIGWSGYVVSFLHDIGLDVPCALSGARGTVVKCADGTSMTAVFNLPAVVIIALVTTLLVIGMKESATTNNVIVFIKLAVVVLFIVFAAHAVNPANWHPFIPA